jgi:hypothetical protein
MGFDRQERNEHTSQKILAMLDKVQKTYQTQ